MQKIFDTLIDSYIDNKIGIADNFLSISLASHLRDNLHQLYSQNLLVPAGIGNNSVVTHDTTIRSDRIHWLDRSHNNPHENTFFDLMDRYVLLLNNTCYTGITGYEFHYALYETGSFYRKHLDQFQNNGSRQYSMILYLNENWKENDGGQLIVHHPDSTQIISPISGKCVFFKSSELEHEVLLTHKPRMSVTGWLKVDPI